MRASDNKTFVPGVLAAENTLAVDLSIVNASVFVYLCATQNATKECPGGVYTDAIGFFSEAGDLAAKPIVAPAKTVAVGAPYNITLLASAGDLFQIVVDTLAYGDILGKLSGNLSASPRRAPLRYARSRVRLAHASPRPRLPAPAATSLSSVNGSEPFALECFYEQALLPLFSK